MSKIILPIETLIEGRIKELGLLQGELTRRIGQRKPPWIYQRLEQIYSGNFEGVADFIPRLSAAIELPLHQIEAAIAHSQATLVEADRQRREAETQQQQAALASYAEIVAGTSIRIPLAMESIIGIARQTKLGVVLRRRSVVQGLSLAAAAAAFPAAVAANSIATVRLRGLKIGSPEYEAGFRAYVRSKYTTRATGMLDHMGRMHAARKEFNEIHRDILEPADPKPGFAHGNFKW